MKATVRIGIDARHASPKGAGKGRYTLELLKALLNESPDNVEWRAYVQGEPSPELLAALPKHPHLTIIRVEGRGPLWHLKLKRELQRHPIDQFIAPLSYLYPAIAGPETRITLVVHDLIAFTDPHHHWFPRLIEQLTLKRALRRASQVVTVSQCTWNALLQRYPWVTRKKHAIVTPAPLEPTPPAPTKPTPATEWPSNFILTVGTLQPRKNLDLICRIFPELAKLHPDLHWVMVGGQGWNEAETFKHFPHALANRIHSPGYVDELTLQMLYKKAKMLLFPSIEEGFGMPVLEAMALGCPVITSSTSSLPEVAGDAAILLSPYDDPAWVNAIHDLLMNNAKRHELAQKGPARAEHFSWAKSAQTLLKLLKL